MRFGILHWRPFLYRFLNYDEKPQEITFTCPCCGSHNCKKIDSIEPNNFWSGYFSCSDCGCSRDAYDNQLCYYSSCFTLSDFIHIEPIQLSLF